MSTGYVNVLRDAGIVAGHIGKYIHVSIITLYDKLLFRLVIDVAIIAVFSLVRNINNANSVIPHYHQTPRIIKNVGTSIDSWQLPL